MGVFPPHRVWRRAAASAAAALACVCAGAGSPRAGAALLVPVPAALRALVFRVYAGESGLPFACTGWYAAPVQTRPPVSVFVTAGHCPTPIIVRTDTGLEAPTVIARLHSIQAGADLTIAERTDPRSPRTYLPMATAAPRVGDPALVMGYGGGRLMTLRLTVAADCQRAFLCFTSSGPIPGGLSGSPIVSLRTGDVLGVLAASPEAAHGPFTVIATPARTVRALMALALPQGPVPPRATLPPARP